MAISEPHITSGVSACMSNSHLLHSDSARFDYPYNRYWIRGRHFLPNSATMKLPVLISRCGNWAWLWPISHTILLLDMVYLPPERMIDFDLKTSLCLFCKVIYVLLLIFDTWAKGQQEYKKQYTVIHVYIISKHVLFSFIKSRYRIQNTELI